jgi:hypothetical protein
MSVVLVLIYPKSAVSEKLFLVLYGVLPVILIGAIVYFLFLLLIDKNTRVLVRKVVLLLTSLTNSK